MALDPEELFEVLRPYHETIGELIPAHARQRIMRQQMPLQPPGHRPQLRGPPVHEDSTMAPKDIQYPPPYLPLTTFHHPTIMAMPIATKAPQASIRPIPPIWTCKRGRERYLCWGYCLRP